MTGVLLNCLSGGGNLLISYIIFSQNMDSAAMRSLNGMVIFLAEYIKRGGYFR